MPRQTVHDRRRNRPVQPEFSIPQAGMVRVGLKDLLEGELDAASRRATRNALRELDRAEMRSRQLRKA